MFETTESETKLHVRMSATLENIDRADDATVLFLKSRDVPVDMFAVRILLREGMLNAVVHGSGQDPDLPVTMDVELDPEGVGLTIEDTGPGFIWQNRSACFDLMGDGGRGLPLMQMYSSRMAFNDSGNKVSFWRKYREAEVCQGATHGECQ